MQREEREERGEKLQIILTTFSLQKLRFEFLIIFGADFIRQGKLMNSYTDPLGEF